MAGAHPDRQYLDSIVRRAVAHAHRLWRAPSEAAASGPRALVQINIRPRPTSHFAWTAAASRRSPHLGSPLARPCAPPGSPSRRRQSRKSQWSRALRAQGVGESPRSRFAGSAPPGSRRSKESGTPAWPHRNALGDAGDSAHGSERAIKAHGHDGAGPEASQRGRPHLVPPGETRGGTGGLAD